MIYRAVQLIQIFLAHGRADGRTKVFQEVLADLKSEIGLLIRGYILKQYLEGGWRLGAGLLEGIFKGKGLGANWN